MKPQPRNSVQAILCRSLWVATGPLGLWFDRRSNMHFH
jgi:hypothetical protein